MAITAPLLKESSLITMLSMSRKASSPFPLITAAGAAPNFSVKHSSASKNFLFKILAAKRPSAVFPQEGIPVSTRFNLPRISARAMSSASPAPCVRENHMSSDKSACSASMISPFAALIPSSSACAVSAVRQGLYTRSMTPFTSGSLRKSAGLCPMFGYIPTGVAFISTLASAQRSP